MQHDIEPVDKIGSMALIHQEESDIDCNVFRHIGRELRPGMIWANSGVAQIGRLNYIKRTGHALGEPSSAVMTDYSTQGQAILMEKYWCYIPSKYSVRQLLVSHTHFNDAEKRAYIHTSTSF
ncbi:hypothetical protein [Neobittarella massiliensis]|uniref:hypothetical protein n=1 Tax=Neobittarella massiliensis (ex Bilen et al. 2018) TaxID=2041842 RepID=UPI000CF6EC64|nr:hypothetical protein [Neobittarella massiliensis]